MLPYPHRVRSVDWKNGGACQRHPESDRINFEMASLIDWDDESRLDPSDITPERYRE